MLLLTSRMLGNIRSRVDMTFCIALLAIFGNPFVNHKFASASITAVQSHPRSQCITALKLLRGFYGLYGRKGGQDGNGLQHGNSRPSFQRWGFIS